VRRAIDLSSELCGGSSIVNAIVRVEERYDQTATVDIFGGYSSYNGLFGGAGFAMRNLRGYGLVWTVNATIGTKITDLESTFQIPRWLDPDGFPTACTSAPSSPASIASKTRRGSVSSRPRRVARG